MHFKHFDISDQFGNKILPACCWVDVHPSEPPQKIDSEREFLYKLNTRVPSHHIALNVDQKLS